MIKHGTSHGLSVIACTIIAAFLSESLKPLLPKFYQYIEKISYWLIERFNFPISLEYLSIALIASILAIMWGFFFRLQFVKPAGS